MTLEGFFKIESRKIERALEARLPEAGKNTSDLFKAIRYAVMSGGKRIRPILTLEACRAVGGDEQRAFPAAIAIELIHNYSLVHDDLPCMDDDALRRGRATCHIRFGEATALLVGDALLTLAFQILSSPVPRSDEKVRSRQLEVLRLISEAAGVHGMVGGQAMDMQFQKKEMNLAAIQFVNAYKTGALIAVSLKAGALMGGGTPRQVDRLFRYGRLIGLLFQVADDMLDSQGYVKILGLSETKKKAQKLLLDAKKELKSFGSEANRLSEIADFILERKY